VSGGIFVPGQKRKSIVDFVELLTYKKHESIGLEISSG